MIRFLRALFGQKHSSSEDILVQEILNSLENKPKEWIHHGYLQHPPTRIMLYLRGYDYTKITAPEEMKLTALNRKKLWDTYQVFLAKQLKNHSELEQD